MKPHAFASAALRLHPDDDVAVLRRAVPAGTLASECGLTVPVLRDLPAGHKIALHPIAAHAPVHKYGQIIGFASQPIQAGDHVHTHNLDMRDFDREHDFGENCRPLVPATSPHHFPGFARPDGRVGTRNYLAVISNVNCSASVSKYVAERFRGQREFPNVDGVIALTHKSGCCIQPGEPMQILQRVLAGMAQHPNIAGYVMIGLGCETSQLETVVTNHRLTSPFVMQIQHLGGIRKTVEAGSAAVAKLLPVANALRRTPQPLSKLTLAMNCGGSDGYSGITANPALGVASDEIVRHGGTSVLAETTEIYGAEHLLTGRAVSAAVAEKLVALIRWWEAHTKLHGATIDNNPTFGNKAGGLTTIYEKSLGAIAKAGQAPLVEVYRYAEPIRTPGLCFMDTPGLDPVSMTGLVAGGCNLGAFTTGRGSVYGCKPAPCLKIATNTALYQHMLDDMDINAGTIMDGTETVEQVGQRIFTKLIAVAGGEKTKSEAQGLGDEEFAPWILGPTF